VGFSAWRDGARGTFEFWSVVRGGLAEAKASFDAPVSDAPYAAFNDLAGAVSSCSLEVEADTFSWIRHCSSIRRFQRERSPCQRCGRSQAALSALAFRKRSFGFGMGSASVSRHFEGIASGVCFEPRVGG
jgi:hypothetical protein